MQLMGDGISVLGSRLGFIWDPVNKMSFLVRHGAYPGIPIEIKAGIRMKDRELYLPLVPDREYFSFFDQNSTTTAVSLSGTDPETAIHIKLTIRVPFRPRDIEFSTIPAVYFDLEVDRFSARFRWIDGVNDENIEGQMFLEIGGAKLSVEPGKRNIKIKYSSEVNIPEETGIDMGPFEPVNIPSADVFSVLEGYLSGKEITGDFNLARGAKGKRISAVWCAFDPPVLDILGTKCPFFYCTLFKTINDVETWAMENADNVRVSCSKIDALFSNHNLGEAVNHLMSYTLHSWLLNTWLVVRPDGRKWFSVWEGSCYFHSTVDVEYTQAPFYLSVWPELLEMELDQWPDFSKDAYSVFGEKGRGTLFLSHDIGYLTDCTRQFYPHEMEVEENSNYIQLAYVHWRRTGNDSIIRKHAGFIAGLMDFIIACDTTGNGIPDKGCANTIDDASPAIQFGSEQIYLGVKAMTSIRAGMEILSYTGNYETEKYSNFVNKAINTIESQGWLGDHYAVTLTRSLDGIVNPWSGEEMSGNLEGWDAYHIYTSNGIAVTESVGMENVLDTERLRLDIANSLVHTKGRYGCRHTSYVNMTPTNLLVPGLAGSAPEVGWVAMNMLRDIAAAYQGIDLFWMAQNYWDWQCTTNTQEVTMFFETFYGNNLCFYPRGLAVFGFAEAALGFSYDGIKKERKFRPVRGFLEIPLYFFADWKNGTAPLVRTELGKGSVTYKVTTGEAET